MNYHHYFLFSMFLLSIAFIAEGQNSTAQKIQQLKDAWYQKAQELSVLGTRLIEKNKQLIALQNELKSTVIEIVSTHNTENINIVVEKLPIATKNFLDKLFQAIRHNVNVRGFLIEELLNHKGDYLNDKDNCPGLFDSIKLILLHIIIETDLTKKLLEDYEAALQEIAEIEHELVLLGQPRLYQ